MLWWKKVTVIGSTRVSGSAVLPVLVELGNVKRQHCTTMHRSCRTWIDVRLLIGSLERFLLGDIPFVHEDAALRHETLGCFLGHS